MVESSNNNSNEVKEFTLISSDQKEVKVAVEIMERSVFIKGMLDDRPDAYKEPVPLATISEDTLKRVVEYLTYVHQHPESEPVLERPLKCKVIDDALPANSPFYKDFMKKYPFEKADDLTDLMNAANYLNIKSLLELAAARFSLYIRNELGGDVKKVRQLFQIENDFTPEEEQNIMEENKWIENVE